MALCGIACCEYDCDGTDKSETDPYRMNDAIRDYLGPIVIPNESPRTVIQTVHHTHLDHDFRRLGAFSKHNFFRRK